MKARRIAVRAAVAESSYQVSKGMAYFYPAALQGDDRAAAPLSRMYVNIDGKVYEIAWDPTTKLAGSTL